MFVLFYGLNSSFTGKSIQTDTEQHVKYRIRIRKMEDMILSTGALPVMMTGVAVTKAVILQVLGSLKIDGIVEEHERYRLLISDGQHVISQVMIAVNIIDMVTTAPPERFSVIYVKEYFTVMVPRAGVLKRMLVFTDIQVLFTADEIQGPIGHPTPLFDDDVTVIPEDSLLASSPDEPVCEPLSLAVLTPPVQILTPVVKPLPAHVQLPSAVVQLPPAPVAQAPPAQILTQVVKPPPAHVQLPSRVVKLSSAAPPPPAQVPAPAVQTPPAPVAQAPPTRTLAPAAIPSTSRTTTLTTFDPLITPIANLKPTMNKWLIKARVTAKSPIKSWNRGSGRSFTVDLADESGEIKASVFTEWIDKYFGVLEKDHVYYIGKGYLKLSNKRYNHLDHDYEMVINGATCVVSCGEEVAVVETKFNFVPLTEVTDRASGSVIDVIGVCTAAAEVELVMTRSGPVPKREVTLTDQSATSVTMKLWGEHAGTFQPSNRPVIAIRGAMLSEYGGVITLSTLVSSVVRINPDIPEAQQLRVWYASSVEQ